MSTRGMTLLEMLLALALTVVMLTLIGQALYFHLYTFQSRRDGVEQSQLARALLQHIANDLRAAVATEALDNKGVEGVSLDPTKLAQTAGVNLPSGTLSTANQNGNNNATNSSATDSEEAAANEDFATSTGFSVGFYGDLTSLQFDITRLPRLDEYDPQFALDGSGSITRIPADVRTVSYAMEGSITVARDALPQAERLHLESLQQATSTMEPRALLRSEQEVSLAGSELTTLSLEADKTLNEERLADDITRLQFLYFDGYEWWPEWNSDDRGGLPLAVEIIVGMANQTLPQNNTSATTSSYDVAAKASETLYRLVVKIPVAVALPYEETTEEMESSDSITAEATP
jgi:type II secretory pathway pseudopilin PulG